MAQDVTISALMFRMQAELWFPEIGARNLRARLNGTALRVGHFRGGSHFHESFPF